MKPKGLFLPAIILFLFAAMPSFAQNKETVKMACANFPPYKIKAKNSSEPDSGIDLDVMRAAFKETGYEVEFEFYPWKRTVAMVERGQADGLCGCAYRPEREEHFIYSDMLGEHSQGVFLSEDSTLQIADGLDDFAGKTIAAVRGYAVHKELKEKTNIKAIEANDDSQLLRLLLNKRVDAIYSYRDILLYRLSFNTDAKKIRYFEFNSQPYYLCFSRAKTDSKQLVEDFNKGLRTIRFNGAYQSIWEKYR